jgi:hypothetical protein
MLLIIPYTSETPLFFLFRLFIFVEFTSEVLHHFDMLQKNNQKPAEEPAKVLIKPDH